MIESYVGADIMYKELAKSEKKELRKKYENSKRSKDLVKTLNRLFIEGVFLIICFFVIVGAIYIVDMSKWYWVIAVITLVFGLVFLIGQFIIRRQEYNKFFGQLSKTEKNKLTKNE